MTDWDKLLKQTTCDKCHGEVAKGKGIVAEGGFYHKDPCWENKKQKFIANYTGDECDIEYTSETVCPYCGYANGNSWELSDNEGEITCGRCESDFEYERIVTVEYCTSKKKAGADGE